MHFSMPPGCGAGPETRFRESSIIGGLSHPSRRGDRGSTIPDRRFNEDSYRNLVLADARRPSAFAFHCPMDMKKIDEALAKKPTLTEAQTKEVAKLR